MISLNLESNVGMISFQVVSFRKNIYLLEKLPDMHIYLVRWISVVADV